MTALDALSAELQALSNVLNLIARSICSPSTTTIPVTLVLKSVSGLLAVVVEQIEEKIG